MRKDPYGNPIYTERRRHGRFLIALGALWGSYCLWMGPDYFPAMFQAIAVMMAGAGKYSWERSNDSGDAES